MRSDTIKKGFHRAPHRSLLKACGAIGLVAAALGLYGYDQVADRLGQLASVRRLATRIVEVTAGSNGVTWASFIPSRARNFRKKGR